MVLGYNSTTPISAEIHSSLLFSWSLSHHLKAQSKAVQAAALKEPSSSRAAARPVAQLGKDGGSARGWPSIPAPAQVSGEQWDSCPWVLCPSKYGLSLQWVLVWGETSDRMQSDTRIANWRQTCQQGDFIWGVTLGSPLPFLFWMPFEQLSVQVFVITQALLLQLFVFGGVARCLYLLSLVICAEKFVRSLYLAGACAHFGAGVGSPWVCWSVITHWMSVDRHRVNLGPVGDVVVTGVVFQNGWAESLQNLTLFSGAWRPWTMCSWWLRQG